eukprot:gnl/MRDRNA2_/MRDRNA2_187007_c0_seq1.p1 gnl/MRDRNA2_/MRDRNA2_187007_c0~~gnl/MRDRNA2_/MRDRNA2_187007_c0_seq1.p1  ORF type:complete len:235 (+),score=37.40 gnl/MRDRNA2_/MRDRNA2_187007_c0_seq1:72-776(+)
MVTTASGCYSVLGLQSGASADEIRKAYLRRARETHPDKGGSEDEFRSIVEAFEALTSQPSASPSTLSKCSGGYPDVSKAQTETRSPPGRSFSLSEISELARQLRGEISREAREKREARRSRAETNLEKARASADAAREKEAGQRLQQALRLQRRHTMPEGIALHTPVGSGRAEFCAIVSIDDEEVVGPPRRSITEAENDLKKLRRTQGRFGDDGVLKALAQLERKALAEKTMWK